MALFAALACGCSKAPTAAETQPAAPVASALPQTVTFDVATLERLGVRTAVAGDRAAVQRLELLGTLDYVIDRYAEVGTLVEGRLTSIAVSVGSRVKKGQPLATVLAPALAGAQAEAISARASLSVARGHAEREAALLEKQLTTAREAEVAQGDVVRAEADLAAAEAKLRVVGSTLPTDARGIRPDGTIVLTAPIEGVVVRRDAVLGAFVEPNDTAFVVADPSVLWALVDVFESDLPFVREGAEVELSVDALAGRKYRAKVAAFEPQIAKNSRALRARVVVENADGALRPGLFVRARVAIDETGSPDLAVPSAAVQPIGGRDVVFVEREPGRFEVRPVTVVRRTPRVVELSDGLARGEKVVVHGAFVLRGEVTRQ